MTTITVRANEISQPAYVGAGSRITLTGSGYVEWCGARTLQDALNGSLTWSQWPGGTSEGSQDVVRGMAIRVVGTGDCTVTVEAGRRDDVPNGQYWDAETITAQTDPLTGGIAGINLGEATGAVEIDQVSNALLTEMGYNRADVAALPRGMKDLNDWLVTLRAIDDNRIDNATNGISGSKYTRDYHGYVGENTHKWSVNEPAQNAIDWSRADTVEAQLPSAPTRRAFHTLFGQNIYLPAWVATALGNDASQITALVAKRVADVAAKYPDDRFYRIDVVNEVLNELNSSASAGNYAATRGWRLTNNALYTAGVTSNINGNPQQWIWDAFTQARAAFPSAKLAWVDFGLETVQPCDSYFRGMLPPIFRTLSKSGNTISSADLCAYSTNNDRQALVAKINRARYEVWRARAAGVPIDVIGYQYHIDTFAPPNFDDLIATLWDWNRFGVTPAITELNVRNTFNSTPVGSFPAHIRRSGSDEINRFGAYLAHGYVKTMLDHSPCEEVTWWSPAYDAAGGGQTATFLSRDYPVRTAVMLAIANAKAPDQRTIRRGSRINCRFVLPLWVTNSEGGMTNLSHSSNRVAITAAASLQVPWSWYSDTWMQRPISASDLILSAQFQISGGTAGDSVLMGYGNATSGTPTNGAYLIINGTTLRLDIIVGGSTVLSQQIATGITTATDHRVAVRINGTGISYSYDGGTVATATATGSFNDQTSVYLLSRPDKTGFSANLSAYFFEIHHGADYNTNALLQGVSAPIIRDCSLSGYLGN